MSGAKLEITLHSGSDLKKTDWLKNADPYVKVTVGGKTETGPVHTRGGPSPSWNAHKMNFKVGNDNQIKFEVWDKDTLTKDDFMGGTSFSLFELPPGRVFHGNLPDEKKKPAGQILVTISHIF